MNVEMISHNGGLESLPKNESEELLCAIRGCDVKIRRGCGADLRAQIVDKLKQTGWPDKVKIAIEHKITVASMKNHVGLCIQTSGNMSRMYADLIKLQQLYLDDVVQVGIFILPTGLAAKQMGDNLANSDRLANELQLFRKVIHMPLVIFSFE